MTWTFQPLVLKRLLLFSVLLCVAIANAVQTDKQAPKDEGPLVLKTFAIGEFAFQLVIEPCHNDECPIEVLLLKGEAVADRVKMPVAATSRDVNVEDVDEAWGADPRLKGWGSGIEDGYVGTTARLIRLAPNQTGLLVDQLDGFQVLKRQHVLLLPKGDKLRKIWSFEEGQGPTWSETRVVPAQTLDRQDLVVFIGFSNPDPGILNQMQAQRLHWDTALHAIKKTMLPNAKQSMFLLQMGVYSTVAAAQKANGRDADCAHGLWVLSTNPYSGLPAGKVLLGIFYATSSEAEAAAAKIRNCSSRLTPLVLEVFSRRRSAALPAAHR